MAHNGDIKVALEVFEELVEGTDELSEWARNQNNKEAILLQEDAEPELIAQVIDDGYANDLTDDEIEKLGRDPFLIAYALANATERTIVTTENSKPAKQRANRKVPDVCGQFGVECINTFELIRRLDFHTGWNNTK